ncbi:MAG: hypothetical protein H7837_13615 [Magnetococcus sp. MYC-9]
MVDPTPLYLVYGNEMTEICSHPSPEGMESPTDTEHLLSKEGVITHLQSPGVQDALATLFVDYWVEFYDVYVSAVTLKAGRRPDQITNEMFSALHHLARGLVVPGSNPVVEIEKARSSHIKRATMDSFKIAINTALEADTALEEELDHIIGNEELSRRENYRELLNNLTQIKGLQRRARTAYEAARKKEAHGCFPEAMQEYKNALEHGLRMGEVLRGFRDDPLVIAALVKEGKRTRERNEDKEEQRRARRTDRWILAVLTLFAAVVGSATTVGFRDYILPNYFSAPVASRQTTPQ